jgi:hypothetical protein
MVSETLKKLVDVTLGVDFLFDFSLMFEEVESYQSNVSWCAQAYSGMCCLQHLILRYSSSTALIGRPVFPLAQSYIESCPSTS